MSTVLLEFVQPVPLHSPQATEHSSPFFLQVHLLVSQFVLQLYRIMFSNLEGIASIVHLTGTRFPLATFQPHSHGFRLSLFFPISFEDKPSGYEMKPHLMLAAKYEFERMFCLSILLQQTSCSEEHSVLHMEHHYIKRK